ncbi:MAG TPA: FAD-binding protein [Thermoleophilaceae bacterium]|nr:FAD-binding protein [Thermoleophilaceae bacterium]
MSDLVVAGAGMAGLVAAAEARRLGAAPVVFEKLGRAGGSMRLSSGVIWRHRELDRFLAECPGGDPDLQRLLFERLDADLRWLESLGAPVATRGTGNPLTAGVRFDPEGLTAALVAAAAGVRLSSPLRELPATAPAILATGGFAADPALVREHVTPEADHLLLRAEPGSTGDGLRLGLAAGAVLGVGLDEVYARAMPAPPARVAPADFVRLSQLYALHAEVTNERGERHETATWSEIDTAQWMARQPRARAWFRVPRAALGERVRDRTVGEMVEAAAAAGAPVRRDAEHVTVESVAGITTTLGGLRIDGAARAARGVFACGADAGGIATGGYASGLAAALVFGRIAARAALGEGP